GLGVTVRPEDEMFVAYVSDDLPRGDLDNLSSPQRVARIQDVMRRIVEAEGPLSPVRLVRIVAHTHGLTRVTDDRLAQLTGIVPRELRRDPEDGFVWPPSRDPVQWKGFRRYAGPVKERPLEDVALREIANAMVVIADTAMGIATVELFKETYRLFGGSRLTAPARARMDAALKVASGERRLDVSGDQISPR
ncbi:MAG: DUF3320 domain-containing protein, partial [Actinomycetota bacterium]|nr:DUF3320 domain-containing protein [Actinomycetota bacterium]